MKHYKVTKGSVGDWPEGTIISDDDLAKAPQFGGVKRLRDELHVIEDHFQPPGKASNLPSGQVVEDAGDNKTSGHLEPGASSAAGEGDDPNAKGHARRGKS